MHLIAYLAAFTLFVCSPNALTPEATVKIMTKKLFEVQTFTYTTEIRITVFGKKKETLILSAKGSRGIHQGSLTVTLKMAPDEILTEVDIRIVEETVYIKLSKVSKDLIPEELSPFFASIDNQWIKISGVPDEILEYVKQKDKELPELSTDLENRLKDAYFRANLLTVTHIFENQIVSSKECLYYAWTLNKKELALFLVNIDQILSEGLLTEEEKDFYTELVNEVKVSYGEVWIGKDDGLLYKFLSKTVFALPFVGDGKNTYIHIDILAAFDKFNEPVTIEKPASTKTLEEILDQKTEEPFEEDTREH